LLASPGRHTFGQVSPRVVVDDRIRVRSEDLPEEVEAGLRARFEYPNAKRQMLRALGKKAWRSQPEKLCTWWWGEGELTLPRGGMRRLREALREAGISWTVSDERTDGLEELAGQIPECRREPWPHQAEALASWLPKQQGIVRAPTGSGKSIFGFMAARAVNLPTLVLVDTTALLKQWVKSAGKELGLSPDEVGVIQGPAERIRPLTIGMAQTVTRKARSLANVFGLLIFDEVHVAGAASFMGAADPMRAKYRLGISADERRKDKRDFLIYDVFGEVVHEVKRDALEESGHVLDVRVVAVPTEFRADWYGMGEGDDGEEREVDFNRLLDEMVPDRARNEVVLGIVRGQLARGEQVLVMSRRVEHCQLLNQMLAAEGVRAGFMLGGAEARREFERTIAGLESGELRVGIGTLQAIGKGLDLPRVGRVVVATPIAGNKQFFGQVRGRACRAPEGKRDAVLYYVWDRLCSFGPKHLRNLAAWNRNCHVLEDGALREAKQKRRSLFAA
jgi:superfamily II DNA or RNA helicase